MYVFLIYSSSVQQKTAMMVMMVLVCLVKALRVNQV